ncbi:MAG: HypC/HybG/HupF family hydrogenase formation chaperone [Candidatus Odinarchaeia archaeon]
MCLAIPAKVIEKTGKKAIVNFGGDTTRKVDVSLVDVKIGDYVIVHAGFAIEKLDEKEAKKTLKAINEVFDF